MEFIDIGQIHKVQQSTFHSLKYDQNNYLEH